MSELVRFGVSIEQDLLEKYDELITESGYANRSEAIRDLIREALIQEKLDAEGETESLGSLTLVYDHHARNLSGEMAEIQHDHHHNIISVMHLHVSHDDCLEILALKGKVGELVNLSNSLLILKGIKNGKLYLTLPSSKIVG
ncbi:MAG TPA: nickel-responsive transcriptional regulator NikR [Pyrinomonadaceae bacterium]|nr:nickel-responsive transcriptional regulator NikR [Pyrinomonadaceae bacterium]